MQPPTTRRWPCWNREPFGLDSAIDVRYLVRHNCQTALLNKCCWFLSYCFLSTLKWKEYGFFNKKNLKNTIARLILYMLGHNMIDQIQPPVKPSNGRSGILRVMWPLNTWVMDPSASGILSLGITHYHLRSTGILIRRRGYSSSEVQSASSAPADRATDLLRKSFDRVLCWRRLIRITTYTTTQSNTNLHDATVTCINASVIKVFIFLHNLFPYQYK